MNNLILYAIIIFIIYHLLLKKKECYNSLENKAVEEGIKAFNIYRSETNPVEKKEKERILTEKYEALLKVNPNIFDNGIPDDIKRRIL